MDDFSDMGNLFNFSEKFKHFTQDSENPICNISSEDGVKQKYITRKELPEALMNSFVQLFAYSVFISSFMITICITIVLLSTIYSYYNNNILSTVIIAFITMSFLASTIFINLQYSNSKETVNKLGTNNCSLNLDLLDPFPEEKK